MDKRYLELYWIFILCDKNKFFIDNSHNCCPKKKYTKNKYGEDIISIESFIIKPFNSIDFYGCEFCCKYHFCCSSKFDCPLVINNDHKVCIFSGKIVDKISLVLNFHEENNFKSDSSPIKYKKKVTILKRSIPDIKGNKINFYDNDINNKPFNINTIPKNNNNNNNNHFDNQLKTIKKLNKSPQNIYTKMKSSITSGPIYNEELVILKDKSESYKEDNNYEFFEYDHSHDQINSFNQDFKIILNDYFSYLDEIIDQNLILLQPYHKRCKKYCLLNKQQQIRNDLLGEEKFTNLFLKNYSFSNFEHVIISEIEYIIKKIDNTINLDIKFRYIKYINKIITLVYGSPFMKKSIEKFIEKSKEKNKETKSKFLDNQLSIAIKIMNFKKICYSLLLDLFTINYFIPDFKGFNILIWNKDDWLFSKKMELQSNPNSIYNDLDFNNSNFISNSLISYGNYPNWLRGEIFENNNY
jgi:hypothetical protein